MEQPVYRAVSPETIKKQPIEYVLAHLRGFYGPSLIDRALEPAEEPNSPGENYLNAQDPERIARDLAITTFLLLDAEKSGDLVRAMMIGPLNPDVDEVTAIEAIRNGADPSETAKILLRD